MFSYDFIQFKREMEILGIEGSFFQPEVVHSLPVTLATRVVETVKVLEQEDLLRTTLYILYRKIYAPPAVNIILDNKRFQSEIRIYMHPLGYMRGCFMEIAVHKKSEKYEGEYEQERRSMHKTIKDMRDRMMKLYRDM